MANKLSVTDVNVAGQRVFLRVDFNVPLTDDGKVADATRIKASLPTIKYLLDNNARVILASHLGRPKGKKDPKYSLAPAAKELARLIDRPVKMVGDCIGREVESEVERMNNGDIVMLENVRFYKEEEANDPAFAANLAKLCSLYVNDAFGSSHRAHASVAGIASHVKAVAGFLLKKEIDALGKVLTNPARPYAVILGGAKVSDKILVIEKLMAKANMLLIGGGMAYTFLKAQGETIGNSLFEAEQEEFARKLMQEARSKGIEIVLPVDHVVTDKIETPANAKGSAIDIADGWIGVDIGEKSSALFISKLERTKTVLWNGPVGIFETAQYSAGTKKIAQFLGAQCSAGKTEVVVGGGDTAAAVEEFGVAAKMTHVSTGGGASLELLEGKILPGIAVLADGNAR